MAFAKETVTAGAWTHAQQHPIRIIAGGGLTANAILNAGESATVTAGDISYEY